MPEVIFPGPEGRLEGRYHPQKDRDAPIAIVLHPHPQFGGTMSNKVVYNLHYAFYNMGFTVLRFNFRGVGRSQGEYDQGRQAGQKEHEPHLTCARIGCGSQASTSDRDHA